MTKCSNCNQPTRVSHFLFPRKEILCAECASLRLQAKIMCGALKKGVRKHDPDQH